jgi:hypothetical protein
MTEFSSAQKKVFGGRCFLAFFLGSIFTGVSFSIMDPLEYGIAYNTVSKGIDAGRVYTSGRYYLGVARSFLRFPATRQTITFEPGGDSASLVVRIAQGQVTVDCSLQYSLDPYQLITLYRNYERNFHGRYVSLATSTIQSAMQGVDLADFYQNRSLVQAVTLTALRTAFAAQFSVCHDFQLRRVALPAQNEQTIINKLVSEQHTKTVQNVQLQQAIVAQTNVVEGEIQLEVDLFRANMTRQATVIAQAAAAYAKQARVNAESGVYPMLAGTLSFNNSELLRYLYLKGVKGMASGSVAAGFTAPVAFLNARAGA